MNNDSQENYHYLLGTLHGLPKKFFKEEIIQAIKGSDTLVTEIHTTRIRDYPELGEFSELSREDIGIKGFLWNKSSPWTPLLCSDHLKLIREGIEATLKKAWGLELDEIHPILVGSIIDQNIQMKAAFTQQGEEPMDIFIGEYFGLLTNKIIGLENYSDRLNASDELEKLNRNKESLSLNEIIKDITERINLADKKSSSSPISLEQQEVREKEKDAEKNLYQEMIDAYMNANLDYFSHFITTSTTKRNRMWFPRIQKIIQDNPTQRFTFMVGAGHLPGEYGLLNLFEKEGYNIG
ncbi:MAG: TraB/GumN family protein [Candidatus Nucleicultricaceae bacterium]